MLFDDSYIWTVLGMSGVTFLPRWLPLMFLSKRQLPQLFVEWLDFIPVSIISALLLPALVLHGDPREIDLLRPEPWVALPTFLVAWKTRSLGGTVVVGILIYWIATL